MPKKKFLNIWVLFIAVLICSGCARKEVVSTEVLEEENIGNSSLVHIQSGNVSGSGVIFKITENSMIITTAGHVLEQAEDGVKVVFGDGTIGESDSYYCSKTSETAFIRLKLEQLPNTVQQQCQAVQTDKKKYDALSEGAEMQMQGAEVEDCVWGSLLYPWIYVEDFDQYMMLVQGETYAGMSGGGLFDAEGNYVGILCGVNELGQTAAVPLNIILAEYAQEYE